MTLYYARGKFFAGALVVSLVASSAAYGNNCAGGSPKDIVTTAVEAGTFKTLATALTQAGLVETLKGPGPFTVFAPTDDAFALLPKQVVDDLLKPENKNRLIAVLTYHVVSGEVPSAKALGLTKAKTINGQQLDLAVANGGLTIDGAKVTAADIRCSNGIIHVIDKVVLPSEWNIPQTAEKAGNFKTLLAALSAAELATVLGGAGPFTVFAPTDGAFSKLPAGTVESLLQPENRQKLAAILKYHVVAGRVFASDALSAGNLTTLQGQALSAQMKDGAPRINDAGIVATDLDTSNGVIHVIDQVLLPSEEKRADRAESRRVIELAINRGAPLFNQGHAMACAAIYEVAATSLIVTGVDSQTRHSLDMALTEMRSSNSHQEQAWILRHALDEAYAAM